MKLLPDLSAVPFFTVFLTQQPGCKPDHVTLNQYPPGSPHLTRGKGQSPHSGQHGPMGPDLLLPS